VHFAKRTASRDFNNFWAIAEAHRCVLQVRTESLLDRAFGTDDQDIRGFTQSEGFHELAVFVSCQQPRQAGGTGDPRMDDRVPIDWCDKKV